MIECFAEVLDASNSRGQLILKITKLIQENERGVPSKQGIILEIPEEILLRIAAGNEYPRYKINPYNDLWLSDMREQFNGIVQAMEKKIREYTGIDRFELPRFYKKILEFRGDFGA